MYGTQKVVILILHSTFNRGYAHTFRALNIIVVPKLYRVLYCYALPIVKIPLQSKHEDIEALNIKRQNVITRNEVEIR